jgi:glycosyltransferase involved in cell wall biosynthesis
MVEIIYSDSGKMTGILRFSLDLMEGLRKEGVMVTPRRVRKIEMNIFGHPVGGWISQKFFAYWMPSSSPPVHSTAQWLISRHTDIVTVHDIIPYLYPQLYNLTDAQIRFGWVNSLEKLQHVRTIVADSYATSQSISPFIKNHDIAIHVIHIGVRKRMPSGKNPYPDDGRKHLITVGDFSPRKKFDVLYQYMRDTEDADLYHIGRIAYEEVYKSCMQVKPQNVHYLGYLPDQLVTDYMAYADAFVFYSIAEGQGLPPMEAMRLGTQAIVNDIPVFHETLGERAYYFSDYDSFRKAIASPRKSGLSEQIAQFDGWVNKYAKIYDSLDGKS